MWIEPGITADDWQVTYRYWLDELPRLNASLSKIIQARGHWNIKCSISRQRVNIRCGKAVES
ncbi:MAG: hypothetical protein ACRYFS_15255 [Janthinobacterium lividum]